jgi:hypothetical protein
MNQPKSIRHFLGLAACVCLTAIPSAHAAAVVSANVTFNVTTSLYNYSYSVQNTGLVDDLVLISIPTDSLLGVSNIMAAPGFTLNYDPSQKWINLIEDGSILTAQTLAPGTTVTPFSYSSASGPGTVTYVAFDASGTEFNGQTLSAVPEPTGSLLCGLAALPLLRRRRA